MLLYPNPVADYPADWIQELASFKNKDEIIKLEKKDVEGLLKNPDLLSFYRRIEELCDIPFIPELPPLPEEAWSFLYMIPKKQHEIKKLAPFIFQSSQKNALQEIIDVGGGIGLLAQSLSNHYPLKVTSLDLDQAMQNTGSGLHVKNPRYPVNKVNYLNLKVHSEELRFTQLLHEKAMIVGLHACGPLSVDLIRSGIDAKTGQILSFGCCYEKLGRRGENQNISSFAKSQENPLSLNFYALTLATRAHRKMDEKDYNLKLKVKLFRYAFHFLLHDEYAQKEMVTLGNSKPQLYEESFGVYALDQLQRLGIAPRHSLEELNAYYSDGSRLELIWKMLAAGLIRNALGRLLELYILLDRALFLEEHGYAVEVFQFFDEGLSPRNLGIVASAKEII
jgi:hypothetical protein